MTRFNSLTRRFGSLLFGLILAVGLIAPLTVGAAKPTVAFSNQPGNTPPFNPCAIMACPKLPVITNIAVGVSYDGVRISFDENMTGDPLWGMARVEILKNGQVLASDEQFAAPGGNRHLDFAFDGLNAEQQYEYKIYREVGADSYIPHLYDDGMFSTD